MARVKAPKVLGVGWGGRIRTFDLLIQSQAPYHLATPQRCAVACYQRTDFEPDLALCLVEIGGGACPSSTSALSVVPNQGPVLHSSGRQ